ncbi:MAG: hypothetical protein JST31_03640 [Actinobacteria bacterium]|nr:hypothetical protein [Actinomycetota bacterium]
MSATGNSSYGTIRRSVLAIALALLLLALGSGQAVAGTSVPGGARTNLSIDGGTARLVGPEALITVACEGPRDGFCSGTLSFHRAGQTREEPFSVGAGSRESLAVFVGRGFAVSGGSAVAVARTAQAGGGLAQSRAVVRFR